MKIEIDISKNIFSQFADQLDCTPEGNHLSIGNEIGTGDLKSTFFPGTIELHHVTFKLNTPVELQSFNSLESDWLLLNANLSKSKVEKTVNQEPISIHRFLPSGILLYSPGTTVRSVSPAGKDFEIALIRFKRAFINQYNVPSDFFEFENAVNAIIYEDLDYNLESILQHAIQAADNIIKHAKVIEFVGHFFQKINLRDKEALFDNLDSNDLQGLFLASAYLRNPKQTQLPTIDELANISGMSATKFKTAFKQVFGAPPIKYHTKIKLEYARDELYAGHKTPSELSYELGYSHPSKFTRAFKNLFDVLPSDL